MGDWITSKTHRYISVRQFPSDYIIKKFHKNDPKALKQFHDHAKLYNDFYQKFVEKVTGNDYQYYIDEYMFGTKEATKEEVHETSGISVCDAGNYVQYCIPLREGVIFDWLIDQLEGSKLKHKVLKKTRGTYMDHGVSTFHRDSNRTPNNIRQLLKGKKNVVK